MDANLYTLLSRRFRAALDRPALVFPGGGPGGDDSGWTYRQLDEYSSRLAALLVSRGVQPGDRVVVQVPKSSAAVALYLACLRTGAVFVPLNTAYTEAEVDFFVGDCEPRLFVASRQVDRADLRVEVLGPSTDAPLWREALSMQPHEEIVARKEPDLAAIVYTSGTTGVSKGAMLTHGNLASNALALTSLWGFGPQDVLLHALPIYHVHGLFIALHCAFLSATSVLFLERFDASEVRALLPRATVFMGVPTFYTRLLGLEGFGAQDCRRMRLFISGSAPLLAETWHEFERRTGQEILERYGMTEAGMITSNPLDGSRVPGTVGFALPDVATRIVGDDGAAVDVGESGVLEIRGPNVFPGYWRRPDRNKSEFREDGYFATGDIAVTDHEGRITLVGRAKDLIITGGLNVYPREVESVLDGVPGVEESAVVGVPDDDFGEAVVAVVVPSSDPRVTEAALREAAGKHLARFKHPKRFVFLEELPRNAMGKVRKNVLRDLVGEAATSAGAGP